MTQLPPQQFYLSRLQTKELDWLARSANNMIHQAERQSETDPLHSWLFTSAIAELDRRASDGSEQPVEPTELVLPNWSDAELAIAIVRVTVISLVTHPQQVGRLFDWIAIEVANMVADRLTRLARTPQ